MKLTKYGIESMGFQELPTDQSITARFEAFRIYDVRGVTLKEGSPADARVILWPDVKFAFGNSVNQLTKALVGEEYTEDETEWCNKSGASPPYLVVLVGPTSASTVAGAFAQRHDGELITYDAFANLKKELQGREDSVLQSLLPALALAFSDRIQPVSFHQVARQVFGRTADNETFVDVRLSMSATGYVSSPIADPEFTSLLDWAADITTRLAPDIMRFYYLGLFEDDPLKRFLFFFLFLERYIHKPSRHCAGCMRRPPCCPFPPVCQSPRPSSRRNCRKARERSLHASCGARFNRGQPWATMMSRDSPISSERETSCRTES